MNLRLTLVPIVVERWIWLVPHSCATISKVTLTLDEFFKVLGFGGNFLFQLLNIFLSFFLDENYPWMSEFLDSFLTFLFSFRHSLSVGSFQLKFALLKLFNKFLIFLSLGLGLFIDLVILFLLHGLDSLSEPEFGLSERHVEFVKFFDLLLFFGLRLALVFLL